MKQAKYIKAIVVVALALAPMLASAQEATEQPQTSYFSNALFNSLLATIVLLLGVISALAGVVKSLLKNETFKKRIREKAANKTNVAGLVILFTLISASGFAEGNAAAPVKANDWLIGGMEPYLFYLMVGVIAIEVAMIYYFSTLIKGLVKPDPIEEAIANQGKPVVKEKTIIDKLNASIDIDREEEIMLDHDYDGIKELDNDLPPWWKYGFYLTIVSGVIYLFHFHVSKSGDLQTAEYNKEVAAAKLKLDEYMKTAANNVDETTVKFLSSASDIDAGKQVFTASCVACHGKLGEGGVGPNLTDNYWLHSGGISDVFKSIKYGWADKGMKSWKEDLSPMQIAQVASYIKSLAGTNPPNGKAPQGDLYTESGVAPSDSTKVDSTLVPIDTTKLALPIKDTVKVKAKK